MTWGYKSQKTTKLDLVNAIAEATGYPKVEIDRTVETLLLRIKYALRSAKPGGPFSLELRGFGRFYTKVRQPRPARNPRTGDQVYLPRRQTLLWKPFFKLQPITQEEPQKC